MGQVSPFYISYFCLVVFWSDVFFSYYSGVFVHNEEKTLSTGDRSSEDVQVFCHFPCSVYVYNKICSPLSSFAINAEREISGDK